MSAHLPSPVPRSPSSSLASVVARELRPRRVTAMSVIEAANTPQTVAVAPAPPAVPHPAPAARRSAAQIYAAALLTLGVAGIHFAAAAGHLAEYLPYGIFFIGLGLAQVALAVAIVVAPSTRLFLAAALGTAAVIALWFVSRITGLPIAPDPWRPEIPGMLDMFATLTEIISVVLFLLLARTPHKPKARGRVRVALSTLPAVPLAALAGWMAVGSALHPMPAAFNTAPAVAGQPSTSVADLVAAPGSEPLKVYTLVVHTGADGSSVAINGSHRLHLDAAPGDTVRLRIVNANDPPLDGSPIRPALLGAGYRVVALDGHDLNAPQEIGPERIPLGMGQRADLVFTMPPSGEVELAGLIHHTPGNPFPTEPVSPVTLGDGPAPTAVKLDSLPRFDLTTYGAAARDPLADATAFDVTREVGLGGSPAFYNGTYDFTDTFSGYTSPYVPPIRVREGQLVHLRIVNTTTGKFHPIHIHGHVFTVLAKNGHPLTGRPVHVDAILAGPKETWDVAFKADNPGIWMLHCHVLGHAVAGMMMTINYEGISTPYTMGTDSGNVPE